VTTVPRTILDLAATESVEVVGNLLRESDPLEGKRYQVDCHRLGTGQIVELDGWEGHGTRTAFREDRARDMKLRVAGYSVSRLTWNQLDDEPDVAASDLLALLDKPLRAGP